MKKYMALEIRIQELTKIVKLQNEQIAKLGNMYQQLLLKLQEQQSKEKCKERSKDRSNNCR